MSTIEYDLDTSGGLMDVSRLSFVFAWKIKARKWRKWWLESISLAYFSLGETEHLIKRFYLIYINVWHSCLIFICFYVYITKVIISFCSVHEFHLIHKITEIFISIKYHHQQINCYYFSKFKCSLLLHKAMSQKRSVKKPGLSTHILRDLAKVTTMTVVMLVVKEEL